MEFRQGPVEGVEVNREFWKGKKVLVTAHTGFKGSWLSLWLQSLDAEVIGYSLSVPTNPSLFYLAEVGNKMETLWGDVRDFTSLKGFIVARHPTIIFHMAAQPIVRQSYLDPIETYSTNVMGTVNLLEAVRQAGGVKAVVIITSDKCYENKEVLRGYCEDDRLGGYDPYSSSKGCAEFVTAAFRHSFFNPGNMDHHGTALASARAGNCIGGGDWASDRLIPDIMRALFEGQQVLIRYPNSVRPWQHVLEPIRGYLMVAEKLAAGADAAASGWNFGPDRHDERAVIEVAEAVVKALGKGRIRIEDSGADLHEAKLLRLDCTRARVELGWVPALRFQDCIRLTADWYGDWATGRPAAEICRDQIAEYEGMFSK